MEKIAYPIREATERKKSLMEKLSPEVSSYVQRSSNCAYDECNILKTTTSFNIETVSKESVHNLVNLKRANDLQDFNSFFEAVNAALATNGFYIGCFESKEQRKERIFAKMAKPLAYIFYIIDFIWKRVFPKLAITKKFYFALTKGHNRVLTLSEVLGRLISCGFKIVDYSQIGNKTYFTIQKISKPVFDEDPTYGPLISLDRVGKNGKIISVYKVRTMHPFSEYLQEYVYNHNKLKNGGKFKDDFRITSWGSFLRKFWLDEFPMFYNLLRGELKLIGVRPLSPQYFALYPNSFQERRKQYKPGLIPPFYYDLPETLDEIMASEKKYLMRFEKHPVITDGRYFFKSLYNILIKGARSN